jgi:hypothetical protein
MLAKLGSNSEPSFFHAPLLLWLFVLAKFAAAISQFEQFLLTCRIFQSIYLLRTLNERQLDSVRLVLN